MIVDLSSVTDAELEVLAAELAGLDFSHPSRKAFLTATHSCDVQAVPGAGKTTLLAAKLELIGRRLNGDRRGVAVISHTNVARNEIEQRLASRAKGSVMLRYPHFVGTLTRFVHDHIAQPVIRGLGWSVRAIDDELHNQRAIALLTRGGAGGWLANQGPNPKPQKHIDKVRAGAAAVAGDLQLDPNRWLRLKLLRNLKDRSSMTFLALQATKDQLTKAGVFSYADALAVSLYALRGCPAVTASIARRFPLLILDEAQDTGDESLAILSEIQKAGATLQRLGDVNQSIYSFHEGVPAWRPRDPVIDLPETRRFGAKIARFASSVGPYRIQSIEPLQEKSDALLIFEYEKDSETEVIKRFAVEARGLVTGPMGPIWAVGHRMNRTKGNLTQIVIPTYCPGVDRVQITSSLSPQSLIAAVRSARLIGPYGALMPEASAILAAGIAAALAFAGIVPNHNWSEGGLRTIRRLGMDHPDRVRSLRTWMSDILSGTPPADNADNWLAAAGRLLDVLVTFPGSTTTDELVAFLSYEEAAEKAVQSPGARIVAEAGGEVITVQVGTIASVKGQTHDATLVLDTDYRAMKAVTKALQRSLGQQGSRKSPSVDEAKLLANIYVGATRPSRLLGLALAKGTLSTSQRDAAISRGWRIVDVCRQSDEPRIETRPRAICGEPLPQPK